MTSLFQRLLLPKLHMHGTLVLGAGFFALLSLQRRLDAAAMGLVPAALVVAGNWLLGSWMLFLLVKSNLLVPMLLLPSIIIAKLVGVDEIRAQFLLQVPTSKRIQIATADGVTLDGFVITRPERTRRWAIWTNANGVPYEQNLEFLEKYSRELNLNVLTFNYRGVGDSAGWPFTAEDLVTDTKAAIEYVLREEGVRPHNLLVHGHSMGGGVLGYLAVAYPDMLLVSDRSFRSLSAVSRAFMVQLGTFMAVALGAIMGVSFALFFAGPQWNLGCYPFRGAFFGGMLGYLVGSFTGVMTYVAPQMLAYSGWELQVAQRWPSERTLCIFHPNDEVIHYEHSSLHGGLAQLSGDLKFRTLQLSGVGRPLPCHMYQLDTHENEWRQVVTAIQELMSEYMPE